MAPVAQWGSFSVPVRSGFGQETDNAAKYEAAGRVERRLLERFRERVLARVTPLAPHRILMRAVARAT